MATKETLNSISQQLNIYLGIFMFIFGIVGAFWNILIFRHYSFRPSSYCTYMLFGSLASLIHLFFDLSDRIINEGFQIYWTSNNIAWCKIRYYIAHCSSLTALSCLVFSAMDRYFLTCHQIKWRRLNSPYIARQICSFIIIIWMLAAIPILIYTKPLQLTSDERLCSSSSLIWSQILTYFFNLCCNGIFPWVFMSLFGFLTLKNLHTIRHRRIGTLSSAVQSRMARIDNQLTSMLFLQIIICMISSIPYCIQSFYDDLTLFLIKDEYRQSQEYLCLQIVRLIFYFNYVSMFYVNYLSSTIFRQLSKQVLVNLFKKHDDISREITVINYQEYNEQLRNRK